MVVTCAVGRQFFFVYRVSPSIFGGVKHFVRHAVTLSDDIKPPLPPLRVLFMLVDDRKTHTDHVRVLQEKRRAILCLPYCILRLRTALGGTAYFE